MLLSHWLDNSLVSLILLLTPIDTGAKKKLLRQIVRVLASSVGFSFLTKSSPKSFSNN